MSRKLKLAVSQSHSLSTVEDTLGSLAATTRQAAAEGVDLLLFPEAYLGGYPRTCGFGATVSTSTDRWDYIVVDAGRQLISLPGWATH